MIALFLCSLGMTGHPQTMFVKEKFGTETIFGIIDIRKVIFTGGNLTVISFNGNSRSFNLADIRYVNFTDMSTGIYSSEKEQSEFLTLFPNPVQDNLTLNYRSLGEAVQFEVMTLDGKTVLKKTIKIHSGITQLEINVSSLPKGLYLCRCIDGHAVLTTKFLKY